LDNDFYGIVLNSEYKINSVFNMQFGGAVSQYKGDHYGNVVSAEGINELNLANLYYESIGDKFDANLYAKVSYRMGKFNVFGDMIGMTIKSKSESYIVPANSILSFVKQIETASKTDTEE